MCRSRDTSNSLTHERWVTTEEPSKDGQLRYPDDIDRPLREAAKKKVLKYQNAANEHSITFVLAIASTCGDASGHRAAGEPNRRGCKHIASHGMRRDLATTDDACTLTTGWRCGPPSHHSTSHWQHTN